MAQFRRDRRGRRPDAGWRRWFVAAPAIVGVALCAAGALTGASGSELELPAYLCVIVGGWALAFATVNAVDGLADPVAWIVHSILALAVIALLSGFLPALEALRTLPGPWRRPLGFALLAVPPAGGWVLLTLLGRVSTLFERRAARRAAALPRPAWSGSDSRPELTITAARFSPRRLTTLVIAVTVVGGIIAAAIVILTERWVTRLGPMALIVLLGVFIGLPLYGIVRTIVNRRRTRITLAWTTGGLAMETGSSWTVPFPTLTRFVWRERGDMARVEVHTAQRSETFLVGMVRQSGGAASELPPLQHRMVRALEHAGFRRRDHRGVVRFDRIADPDRTAPAVSLVDAAQPDRG